MINNIFLLIINKNFATIIDMNKKATLERGSTLFLRLAIIGIGLAVFGIGVILLPSMWHVVDEYPRYAFAVYVVLTTVYLTTIPYFVGLWKAWKVLGLIDTGKAFTITAVNALAYISRCAAIIGGLYILSLPWFYIWADQDDAPGLMVIGLLFSTVPIVVSVCIAVLRRLLYEAIVIKDENDLTV